MIRTTVCTHDSQNAMPAALPSFTTNTLTRVMTTRRAPGKNQTLAWARSNANPPSSFRHATSKSVPVSSYAPSYRGGTVRRKLTRRPTTRAGSRYDEEEEEGYVSGEYDDNPFELVKIRVKVRVPPTPLFHRAKIERDSCTTETTCARWRSHPRPSLKTSWNVSP
jgi:hypothetical protein